MSAAAAVDGQLDRARQLQAEGRLAEAERAYRELAATGEARELALRGLVEIFMKSGRAKDAIEALTALTAKAPDRIYYYARLAALLEGQGEVDRAIAEYRRLIQRKPDLPEAHFNVALLYKKARRFPEALASYEQAIRLGMSGVEEAYCNLGVLYAELRRRDEARQMYERALQARPDYAPALFNLAGLFDESGERDAAVATYRRILELEPRHWDALARLAYTRTLTGADAPYIDSLRGAVEHPDAGPLARETLYFALGKSLDDIGQYEAAFAAYRSGNQLGALRNPPYDRRAAELYFDRLIEVFSRDWLRRATGRRPEQPIFICGMFRSGSTLVEQIIGAHPSVTAGGELDCLPWLVQRQVVPFPERAASATPADLEEWGSQYLSCVRPFCPDADRFTDKRPDNFLYLGLVRAMFPGAKVVYTKRNPADNYLSIYFQQFGGRLGYATDLGNIAHYYAQHARLMTHWIHCFGANIFTVDYDELVAAPEPLLRRLFEFLDIDWDDRCLQFQRADNLVKTASVWQVREELHTRSSGRSLHYLPFMQDVQVG